jgi:hypothetical protein
VASSFGSVMRFALAGLITVAWAASFILNAVTPAYEPPVSLHPLMLIVATGVFGSEAVRAVRNGRNGGGQ